MIFIASDVGRKREEGKRMEREEREGEREERAGGERGRERGDHTHLSSAVWVS